MRRLAQRIIGLCRAEARAVVVVACLIGSGGCQKSADPAQATADPKVLARVGEKELHVEEFQVLVRAREAGSPVAVNAEALLEEWIAKEVLAQSARRAGLEKDPAVQEALVSALIGMLKERQLAPALEAASVTEEEVRVAYESQKERFATPERARLALLFLAAPKAAGAAAESARDRLSAAVALARAERPSAGRGFGALSINYSEDQETRYRGGELGWVERNRYPQRIDPVVIDAGFGLSEPGQISDPVQGENGFYAVMLLERQPASTRAFDDVAPVLRANVLEQKRAQIESTFLAKLRADLRVEVHSERLPASRQITPAVPAMPSSLP